MTKANTSCAPLDIHKWKWALTQLQSFNKGKTYVSLIFSTSQNNFWKRNYTWKHNCNTKHFNHALSTNCKSKWFFTIKSARFLTNIFYSTSSILKGCFEAKNSDIKELEIRDLFFCRLSIYIFFPLIINFFLKPFINCWMIYIKMFLQRCYATCFIICYLTFP